MLTTKSELRYLPVATVMLVMALAHVTPTPALGAPSDTTADVVYGQLGSFTTNTPNKGGLSAASVNFPDGAAVDGNDNLYVADNLNHRVLFYPAGSTTATRVYGQGGSFTTNTCNKGGLSANSLCLPRGLALDSRGNLYVGDTGNARVLFYPAGSTIATRVYGQLGSFTTNTVNKGGLSADSLATPAGVALDSSDNLYVADFNNSRVLVYSERSTTAVQVYGQGGVFNTNTCNKGGLSADTLCGPNDVAVDSSYGFYVADFSNNRVLFYSPVSTTATRVYGQLGSVTSNLCDNGGRSADSLCRPVGVAVDDSDHLYVADGSNNRVLFYPAGITTATQVFGQGGDFTTNAANNGGVSADSLASPRRIAPDSRGRIYIADAGNNRVLWYGIHPSCELKIPVRSFPAGFTATLDGSGSHDDDGTIVKRAFTCGNSTSPSPPGTSNPIVSCTYSTLGHFTATLVVTDDDGLTSHVCQQGVDARANQAPVAKLTAQPTTQKVGSLVTLKGCSSSDADGTIASYAFNFGDGTPALTKTAPTCTATHAYTTAGSFKPCLVVTDNTGASSYAVCTTVTVKANVPPTANFEWKQTPDRAFTLTFTDLSTDSDGLITARAWTFGDGGTSTLQNPTHTYPGGGSVFPACLKVTDTNGATSTTCKQVAAPCSFGFTPPGPQSVPATGASNKTFSVNTDSGCTWSASNLGVSWISVSPAAGTGPGTVTFSVAANGAGSRSATISVAGQSYEINQSAARCSYAITPTSAVMTGAGGSVSVSVSTGSWCPWSAFSDVSWISVSPAAGTGPGTMTVSVATAPSHTTTTRQAFISIIVPESSTGTTQFMVTQTH